MTDLPSDANERHEDVHPDDESSGINRQFVLGGIVVALTLAVAAWLAYGVVQRSSTSPRAAGLVPDGGSHAGRATTTTPGDRANTTTTAKRGATTTTSTRRGGSGTASSSTPDDGGTTPSGGSARCEGCWTAYSGAWIDECHTIWELSTNGKLYDPEDIGSVYTVEDCTRTLDEIFMTANVKSVAKAKTEGRGDAASFTEQLTLSGQLCAIDPATEEIKGCWSNA